MPLTEEEKAKLRDDLNKSDKNLRIVENSRNLQTFLKGLGKISQFQSNVAELKSEYVDFVNKMNTFIDKLNNTYTNDFRKGIDLIAEFGEQYEANIQKEKEKVEDGKKSKRNSKSRRKSRRKNYKNHK